MIKSVKKESAPLANTFPKLMIAAHTNRVVMFSKKNVGMVIQYDAGSMCEGVGYYSESWVMEDFTDYRGTVEICNV